MYEWSRVIFAKKSKFHDAGGPDTVVSPTGDHFKYKYKDIEILRESNNLFNNTHCWKCHKPETIQSTQSMVWDH